MTLLDVFSDDNLDGQETLTFIYPGDDPKADLILLDSDIEWRGRKYFVTEKEDRRKGTEVVTEVRCTALWGRLNNRRRVGSVLMESLTVAEGLEEILANSGWTVGPNTAAGGTTYGYEDQDATLLALIRNWADVATLVVEFNTIDQTVDLISEDDRARDMGLSFRYARNVTTIERRLQVPDITRLYPFGRDDLDISGVNGGEPFIEDYSFYTAQGMTDTEAEARFRKDEVWNSTDIVDEGALLVAAQKRLTERAAGIIEYKMSVVDLTELTGANEEVRTGDQVRVFDPELGVDIQTTVVRRVMHPLEPWRNQVELSYRYDPTDPGGRSTRAQSSLTWEMFQHRAALTKIRTVTGVSIVNRIPVTFAGAAEAVYGFDLKAVGVGTGTLSISALDSENDVLEHKVAEVDFTDGEAIEATWTWSHDSSDENDELNGQKDYRIRLQAVETGGGTSSSAIGIDFDVFDSRMWILARGATKRTPSIDNSETFGYTGVIQQFTVPDNVTEVHLNVTAGDGGDENWGGKGQQAEAKFVVAAGDILDVYVGGTNNGLGGGWPNGGGGAGSGGAQGHGGGGSSDVRPAGGAAADTMLCVGGGGGSGEPFTGSVKQGGDGGHYEAQDGGSDYPGGGGTQWSGGLPADPAPAYPGGPGTFFQGGHATWGGNAFDFPPGGGGGGWYGGAGGGTTGTSGAPGAGGGGGGSGYMRPDGLELIINEGGSLGGGSGDHGEIIISWESPDI